MTDYLADPLWTRGPTGAGTAMVRLDSLPLSAELKARLRAWAARYDALMNSDYEWPSEADKDTWDAEGRALLPLVRAELGPGYDVQYYNYGGNYGDQD